MAKTSLKIKKRMLIMLICFLVLLGALGGRIFCLQFVDGAELQRKAYQQQTKNRTISPNRGTIYDRNHKVLARSATVETISITPKNITKENKEKVAQGLSEILALDYETVLAKTKKNTADEVVAKKLEKDKTDLVREWIDKEDIKGVNIYEDTKRYYPNNNLASHVLGFCGTDNQGLYGIELQFESVLKGVAGKLVVGTDGIGREMPLNNEKYIPAQDGLNLVLTIDEMIQHIAEKYLEQAVIDNKCLGGGVCIIMEPSTGDILAMATKPDFNPNTPFEITLDAYKENWDTMEAKERSAALEKMWRNKAVSDTYEPGSTFKIITSAIAIEEGVVTDIDKAGQFNCIGNIKVSGVTMNCWRYYRPHGAESFRNALQNSCNPVFIKVGIEVGKQIFYKYLDAFGLLGKTGVDLPGEASGYFHKIENVKDLELGTIAFGQRFNITPLSLLNAACAIANDGVLMKPRIVKEITDSEGNVVQTIEPQEVRKVISEKTADSVLSMMESVVSDGTGRYAQVKGYYVGGKTGTGEQGVNQNNFVASFLGVAPAEDPDLAVIFALYDPKGEQGHQGGGIAAPVVGNILNDVLKYLEIPQDYEYTDKENTEAIVPRVIDRTVGEAIKLINKAGLKCSVDESDLNLKIVGQMPQSGEKLKANSVVQLYVEGKDTRFSVEVPDVKQMDVVTATKKLAEKNLNIKISGSGMSILQDPAAGTMVEQGTVVRVEFRPVGVDVE